MTTVVRRTACVLSYRRGRGTLEQQFLFEGATADAIADVLLARNIAVLLDQRGSLVHYRINDSRVV